MLGFSISIGLGGPVAGGGQSQTATAPTLSALTIDTAPDPDVMALTIDKPATVYWIASNSATRTAAQVKAGGDLASGSFTASAGTVNQTIDLSALNGQTIYFHVTAENAAGLGNVVTQHITVYTDVTAPTLSGMAVDVTGQTTADLKAQIDEAGTIWAIAKLATDPTPTVTEMKAVIGQAVTANTLTTITANYLTAGTQYKAWFYAEDNSGNATSVSGGLLFTTQSAITLTYVDQATNNVNVRVPQLNAGLESFVWTFAAYMNCANLGANSYAYLVNGGGSSIRINGDGLVRLVLRNGAGNVVANTTQATGIAFNGGLHHLLIAMDSATGDIRVFVDGTKTNTYSSLTGPVKFDGTSAGPDMFATSANGASIEATQLTQVFFDPVTHIGTGTQEAADVTKFFANGSAKTGLPAAKLILGEDMTVADWNNKVNKGTAGPLVTVKPAGGFL